MNQWHNEQGSTIFEVMKWGEASLEESGRPDAHVDAKLLMLYALGCNETKLLLERQKVMPQKQREDYCHYITIRQSGVPLQHITGTQEFMGLAFKVNEHVLIPRQDTETLIEQLLNKLSKADQLKGIDIGTGTGCIGISMAHFLPHLEMLLIDISKEALKVAEENIGLHQLQDRIQILESDRLKGYNGENVDFIVSNPPYIAQKDMETLMTEVKDHEPHLALTDHGDGLYFYRQISKEAKNYLKKDGLLAYEIGYDQGQAVMAILKDEGYHEIVCYKDLAGQDRVVIARK